MPYKLSATLAAHTSDVRAVATPSNDLILSASRDTTAIAWKRSSPEAPFTPKSTLNPGTRYVNAIAYIPPSPDAPEGYVVTGGQDAIVNIFSLSSLRDDPNFSLLGHTQNVCALDTTADGTIISGSWDQTAKVWKDFQLVHDLVGHSQSVWAVLAVEPEKFLTGSADMTIKLWDHQKNVRTFTGHTQAVRGLALIPDIGFASCANDSEIRVWTFEGDTVYSLSGHTSFVYSLSVLPNGDLVSGGEDRTVRIWRDGECAQIITHPAISVWTVSSMPNGDIVSGCSDGKVRIFSAVESRWASADDLKAYDDLVASTALPAQQVGDVQKSDLPGPEALSQPGKKPGEVKMIRRGQLVEAHQWDANAGSWQKIGDVVDAVGSGRKQLYNGKEYDYVFDVDVEEGAPPLKLPYNVTDNPFSAAQKFLEVHELPLSYLDEVVKFIEKNTAGVNIGTGNNQFIDPYTGATRYQASENTSQRSGQEFMDPFTGASRYRAPSAPASAPPPTVPAPITSSGDPWTGGSRYAGETSTSTRAAAPAPSASSVGLPVPHTLSFKTANISGMQTKLTQIDQTLQHDVSTSTLAMYHNELTFVEEIFLYLNEAVADKPITAPKITAKHVEVLKELLERWPSSVRFPLVDLSRLMIGYCAPAYADATLRQEFLKTLFQAAEFNEPWTARLPKSRETNVLLLLRALANLFQDGTTLGEDGAWAKWVLDRLGEAPYTLLSKTQRIALGTMLFNLSCIGLRERLDNDLRALQVTFITSMLESEKNDSEAAYRALVALGNTVCAAKQHASPLDPAQVASAKVVLGSLPSVFPEDRIRNMASAINGML